MTKHCDNVLPDSADWTPLKTLLVQDAAALPLSLGCGAGVLGQPGRLFGHDSPTTSGRRWASWFASWMVIPRTQCLQAGRVSPVRHEPEEPLAS